MADTEVPADCDDEPKLTAEEWAFVESWGDDADVTAVRFVPAPPDEGKA